VVGTTTATIHVVKRFLKYWLPVLVWLGVIFIGSSDLMSAEHTSRFLIPFLRWLRPDISPEMLALIQFVMRKGAHVAEYAILALLFFRAVYHGSNLKWSMSILCVNIWLVCVLVAALDEFHQSFVESRGASPWDVMIDSAGAVLGLLIGYGLWRRKDRPLE
jgi:VanZ family protein